ncbi:hypothetical protein ACFIQF_22815 [Comamonas sp. J-3]|uniref:hypothetical protein n=1 Tax=Comamonas trifloxystrobinivorans TaxID=3350256 RepID=UPI00372658AF
MTPQEHQLLEAKTRNLAQQVLIDWLADLWRARIAMTPEPERQMTLAAMEAKLQAGEKEYSDLTLPWLDPASSDMQAAMFQDAYSEISKKIMTKVAADLSPREEAAFKAFAASIQP